MSLRGLQNQQTQDKLTRIAIVSNDKCKPKRCHQQCKKSCPVVRMGKLCIEVTPESKIARISETLCIGCGICAKKCPFEALTIINLPSNLEKETTHRYSANSFKLHRLPIPRPGEVLGLVGTNGIGKSTALKILAGKQKPNLGRFNNPPDWQEILLHFRGSELQNYFTKILEDDLKAIIKPQYVDQIPKAVKGSVQSILDRKNEMDNQEHICRQLDLLTVLDRNVDELSGGELQRFACAVVCIQRADIYMFDEPSSYLDVKQRLKCALTIRSLLGDDRTLHHHQLSNPLTVIGINIFLDGFVPTENLRFRDTSLVFKVAETADKEEEVRKMRKYKYPKMEKQLKEFHLGIDAGEFTDSEIIVMLGENVCHHCCHCYLQCAIIVANVGYSVPSLLPLLPTMYHHCCHCYLQCTITVATVTYSVPSLLPMLATVCHHCCHYYLQCTIIVATVTYNNTVRMLLHEKIRDAYVHPQFIADVIKPLQIEQIMDQEVQNLSGGELQRVALTICLGKPADVYLIDEPSAYLDSEQRLVAAKVIKRFILHAKKTGFVVEHDFIMATYLADRVVVFEGEPSVKTLANSPQTLLTGMNKFLQSLEITFRRDPTNFRPRINKMNSVKDTEQKKTGNYFYLED
ncbi:ATP-binding cassette sub-family E member 1-like [Stylophora pistillata]|uniref:ATP-binding cassette sub-family E member 1-like n=1 Tax=Stylophora pistillata TaxID=50429 RepID=UPI000C041731|nr:ATP-binding cassette sub-family E member 1-like [Stylophora pistillata]